MLYDTRTGQPLANVERNELMLVMSRKATEANKDLIPLLLDASRRGERLPVLSRPVAVPNVQRVQQAMGIAHMAQGGTNNNVRFVRGTGIAQDNPGSSGTDRELLQAVGTLIAETQAARRATQRIKYLKVGLLDLERRKTEYEQIKAINKGSRAA
jgi:hypothetical protein